ncbi:DUF1501 domain-containing protein [Arenibacterium halophilum]|uniref:DUF1501 domain-containing protein n=1 Tax=Arenibacterium halophilum TaxID=2583821 RepID=A0ABY2X7D9_9RHOB|nr:DUF1501 domain-containing protein [Arenibacterium halophilum]TMV11704.1 DUF1501 domain-containing protein [Arenibacterium halophilum]
MPNLFTRRHFFARSALIGCSAAASPLLTPVSFAAAPWDTRLVVIILRGAMDGIDVVRPYGAPEYATLRPGEAGGGPDLDGFFGLHPELSDLMPLWNAGELGFYHAVSTPYRDKRSHFDGQDILEAGTPGLDGARDGWLNRLLTKLPGVEARTAYAIGRGDMKLLAGSAPVADWSPDADLVLSPQALRLAERVMEDDPAFHAAFSEALMLSGDSALAPLPDEETMGMGAPVDSNKAHAVIAEYAAEQLRGDARIAAFSINGWDTHNRQSRAIVPALRRLSETLLLLRSGLGNSIWSNTAVIAMTEFGRTVAINGTGGTDHGTGGAMVLAGGAVQGGKVHGDWPGLAESDLYQRRDLMPTRDVRAPAAWIMHGLTGIDRAALEQVVFPGLDMGDDPRVTR